MADTQNPEQHAAAQMLARERCDACDAAKKPGYVFCRDCYLALTLGMRLSLKPASSVAFAAACARCLAFLRGMRANGNLPAPGAARWRYRTTEDLEAAGYVFAGHARCAVPRCWAPITWYWTPNRKRMAINAADCRPHFASCLEPGYFQRKRDEKSEKRRLQTIARRRKATR